MGIQEELKFGTSGIRGRVVDFNMKSCSAYATAFAELLKSHFPETKQIYMARDLRDSSPKIQKMFSDVLTQIGYKVISAGEVPTPALFLYAREQHAASIMITGSHIPADRNGVKFYTPVGEINKSHEVAIRQVYERIISVKKYDPGLNMSFDTAFPGNVMEQEIKGQVEAFYQQRYLDFFPANSLAGIRAGFYEHSTVGRDLFPSILEKLGANVIRFERSNQFIPIDTENVSNIRELDELLVQNDIDLLISADGDGDRPLVIHRKWGQINGDVLGMITAKFLNIENISVPVSCTSLLEVLGYFKNIVRTKVGSPFVIEGIEQLSNTQDFVAGFEANGGFLLGSNISSLTALPTRDVMLPVISFLTLYSSEWLQKNEDKLFSRVNLSGLIKNFPREESKKILEVVGANPQCILQYSAKLAEELKGIDDVNSVDGVKIKTVSGDCVHLRPSGNAPEFRVYVESNAKMKADLLLKETLRFCQSYR